MTTEYYYWQDEKNKDSLKMIKKDSLIEIRKTFIKRNGRGGAAYIFKDGRTVGHLICYEYGQWFYDNYENDRRYKINEDGTIKW